MEAHTPTFSLLSEAPVAAYEVAFSGMRIAAGPEPVLLPQRGSLSPGPHPTVSANTTIL